jgi:hypothetical protein
MMPTTDIVIGIGFAAPERDARRSEKHLRTVVANWVISFAQVLGSPVCNAGNTRIGRVSDVVVRLDVGSKYPLVTGVLFRARNALRRPPATRYTGDVAIGTAGRRRSPCP